MKSHEQKVIIIEVHQVDRSYSKMTEYIWSYIHLISFELHKNK